MMKKPKNESAFIALRSEIHQHASNAHLLSQGYAPVFSASSTAKIVIIGHAPGKKTQETGVPWDDASGKRLLAWLGIEEAAFRDPARVAHMSMDFYYPGKGTSGDLPPRKDFAAMWHTKILQQMPSVELTILVGQYAQKYYLGKRRYQNLTETVRHYKEYAPGYFPLVHPSPLNFRWFSKHPWFEQDVIPGLQARVRRILAD